VPSCLRERPGFDKRHNRLKHPARFTGFMLKYHGARPKPLECFVDQFPLSVFAFPECDDHFPMRPEMIVYTAESHLVERVRNHSE
jgi:hypothetical protein